MKKISTQVMLQYGETVKVGNLKATLVMQVFVYGFKDDGSILMDMDFVDINDISFEGIPIEGYDNWKKFKNFHKEMGIDFDSILNEKANEIFDNDFFKDIVVNDVKNLFKNEK